MIGSAGEIYRRLKCPFCSVQGCPLSTFKVVKRQNARDQIAFYTFLLDIQTIRIASSSSRPQLTAKLEGNETIRRKTAEVVGKSIFVLFLLVTWPSRH